MQTSRKVVDRKAKLEPTKDDPTTKLEEMHKPLKTPRSFLQKTTTADIYSRNGQKKLVTSKTTALNSLKSSPSTISQKSSKSLRSKQVETPKTSARDIKLTKSSSKILPINVTINSPIQKRKDLVDGREKNVTPKEVRLKAKESVIKKVASKDIIDSKRKDTKDVSQKAIGLKTKEESTKKDLPERHRTNTRTLDEKEIKVLTSDIVDNNGELLKLSKKLSAKPKAFYVDLDDGKKEQTNKVKSSDEEYSYEDDFESYESDFDSYHSDRSDNAINSSDHESNGENNGDSDDRIDSDSEKGDKYNDIDEHVDDDGNSKEERMLDSGNFDLRDPRSANRSKPMDFISEASEEIDGKIHDDNDKKTSLTDEGFQDMSSGLSSIKTIHVDVLERPLFIDFTKSKENRRKRRIFEKLKQRAKDILSMVSLHEMSYNLFEMAPIPYDLYMATFGRSNYTQTSVQTFDDGITEEVQTDEILYDNKWTQCPVEFSNNDICLNKSIKKESKGSQEFTFFNYEERTEEALSDEIKNNPLRVFLEQKNGSGSDKFMTKESYKTKLKNNKYDVVKLKKFLKKTESRVSSILNINGNIDMSNLIKTSKFPFSNGYLLISTRNVESFLKNSKIIGAVLSETKNSLIMTVHEILKSGVASGKCVLCLWDLSVAIREPLKILIATDNVKIGKYTGNTDGFFVGALEDGSIHLWDISEEPTWCDDSFRDEVTKLEENETKDLTQTERDREWNSKNSSCILEKDTQYALQACSYTSSGMAVSNNESVASIVGLEFIGEASSSLGDGRKIIRQLCSLQNTGLFTIWSIVQEKRKTKDIGKSLWSKLKLERNQTIKLTDYIITVPIFNETNFNLNAAKKRMTTKRQERRISRPKSAIKSDVDRPKSAAIRKNKIPTDDVFDLFDNFIDFNHLKVMNSAGVDYFLVGINSGEVLCCRRSLGSLAVKRLNVANAASSITRIETSPHNLPYFLAATDCGTVNLCSLVECRVLLTLDCRNSPNPVLDKCQSDNKGRYISSVGLKLSDMDNASNSKHIKSLSWLPTDPFCIIALSDRMFVWELTHSDIQTAGTSGGIAECCCTSDKTLVLLTTEGDVQVYKLNDEKKKLDLFEKYVDLL